MQELAPAELDGLVSFLKRTSLTPSASVGVLVSLTNTFLPQSSNPPDYRPLNEPEEGDEESDKPPVKVLAEVGTVDSVVVWDHEKVPGDDDLFFRGLGEEGLKWRAGMHAF